MGLIELLKTVLKTKNRHISLKSTQNCTRNML